MVLGLFDIQIGSPLVGQFWEIEQVGREENRHGGRIVLEHSKAQFKYYKLGNDKRIYMSLPFTIIIPGQPPITNFQCDNNIYHVDVPNPSLIPNICLTLTTPLPQNYALTLSFSVPPYNQMQYLGAISNNLPSEIFSTGFPLKAEIAQLPSLKLCLKGQTFEEIKDLVSVSDGKKQYTKMVAHNLYNYMMSYNKSGLLVNGIEGEYIVIPSNFLDKWLNKFQYKYSKDPNFIMKTTQS